MGWGCRIQGPGPAAPPWRFVNLAAEGNEPSVPLPQIWHSTERAQVSRTQWPLGCVPTFRFHQFHPVFGFIPSVCPLVFAALLY